MARATPSRDKLETVGIDALCERISAGETYQEIADSLGIGVGTVHAFLHSTHEYAEKSARARTESAEAWLDRGLKPLGEALSKLSEIDAHAARAYEQACARRAAIRNPVYRDHTRVDTNLSGVVGIAALSEEQVANELDSILGSAR